MGLCECASVIYVTDFEKKWIKGTKTIENDIMNLRFNLTQKIQSLIIEMHVNKQMIDEGRVEAEK